MILNLFRSKQSEKLTPKQDAGLPKTDYKIPAKYFKIVETEYNSGRKSILLYSTSSLVGVYAKNTYYRLASNSALDGLFLIACYDSVKEAKKAAQEMYNAMQRSIDENTVKHSKTEYIS